MIFEKRWRESLPGLELDASLSEQYLSAIVLEKKLLLLPRYLLVPLLLNFSKHRLR